MKASAQLNSIAFFAQIGEIRARPFDIPKPKPIYSNSRGALENKRLRYKRRGKETRDLGFICTCTGGQGKWTSLALLPFWIPSLLADYREGPRHDSLTFSGFRRQRNANIWQGFIAERRRTGGETGLRWMQGTRRGRFIGPLVYFRTWRRGPWAAQTAAGPISGAISWLAEKQLCSEPEPSRAIREQIGRGPNSRTFRARIVKFPSRSMGKNENEECGGIVRNAILCK